MLSQSRFKERPRHYALILTDTDALVQRGRGHFPPMHRARSLHEVVRVEQDETVVLIRPSLWRIFLILRRPFEASRWARLQGLSS